MYKIVFFDVDGTLITSEHKISAQTMQAISKLKENGIQVAISTGRAPYDAVEFADQIVADYMICMNGAIVLDRNRVIYHNPIDLNDIQEVTKIAINHRHALFYCGLDKILSAVPEGHSKTGGFSYELFEFPSFQPDYYKSNPVYQMQLFCSNQEMYLYNDLKNRLKIYRWNVQGNGSDVVRMDTNKSNGVKQLLNHLKMDKSYSVAFGDGENDLEMIEYAGFGVAMANAVNPLKEKADFVTKSNNENGIAHALRYLKLI